MGSETNNIIINITVIEHIHEGPSHQYEQEKEWRENQGGECVGHYGGWFLLWLPEQMLWKHKTINNSNRNEVTGTAGLHKYSNHTEFCSDFAWFL